jgi:hypothetical protein
VTALGARTSDRGARKDGTSSASRRPLAMPGREELDCALLSGLSLPSGIYNVCRDGERVSTDRFRQAAGWHPQR